MKGLLPILIRKELLQLRRNKFMPRLIVMFPIIAMLVMPWLMRLDIKNVHVTVIDEDQSSLSRRIVSHIVASPYFVYSDGYVSYTDAINAMDDNKLDVVVSIPREFERKMLSGVSAKKISVVANGVNATKGSQGTQYVLQTIASAINELQVERGLTPQKASYSTLNLYNPTNNAMFYMIPALMIMVILLICGFLPALNIVSEKEKGTIEQLNVTPLSSFQFIIAKLIPYWVFGVVQFGVCMLLAWLVYGLVPEGSILEIFIAGLLFVMVMSAFSVCIANLSNTMQQAILLMFFFLLNFMLLSGLLTPIESMPDVVRYISLIFPPRYLIAIMRAIYLKGTPMLELWPNYLALLIMALLLIFIAIKTHRKQQ